VHCAIAIAQAGLSRVITYRLDEDDERWVESIGKAMTVFDEAGIEYVQIPRDDTRRPDPTLLDGVNR
jgi:hypothetical protein